MCFFSTGGIKKLRRICNLHDAVADGQLPFLTRLTTGYLMAIPNCDGHPQNYPFSELQQLYMFPGLHFGPPDNWPIGSPLQFVHNLGCCAQFGMFLPSFPCLLATEKKEKKHPLGKIYPLNACGVHLTTIVKNKNSYFKSGEVMPQLTFVNILRP